MIGLPNLTKVILNLIIINVLVFFAVYFTPFANMLGMSIGELAGSLSFHFPQSPYFKPFQIITHFFMHQGLAEGYIDGQFVQQISYRHLLYNMIGLYFLGGSVEEYLGEKKFLILYFLAALGGLVGHVIVGYMTGSYNPVLGASGAVAGVVIAFATLFPNRSLMIIPIPFPIKAKWIAFGYIIYDLSQGLFNTGSNIAHFAHLGGALVGFLVVRYFQKSRFS